MEEKERYEIHIYDDICVDLYDNGVLDKSINDTYKLEKLLNQQDKENQQLKQQLHDLSKNIIEDIKEFCEDWKDYDRHYNPAIILVENSGMRTQPTLYNELNTILKKYGGGNE